MATATYVPLATQTLGSAASSITFSSIPSGYKDLRLVLTCKQSSGTVPYLQFNGDTGSNYSSTYLSDNGSSPASSNITSYSSILLSQNVTITSSTIPTSFFVDLMSYSGSTNKTVLGSTAGDLNGSGYIISLVGLWQSTSAITSIFIGGNGSNFSVGTTATLWGI